MQRNGRLGKDELVRNGGGQHWRVAWERGQFAKAGDEEDSKAMPSSAMQA